MKDLARLLAAALFGAAIAVEGSAFAQKTEPSHMDVRFDRLERGMDVLASQIADVDRDLRNACGNR